MVLWGGLHDEAPGKLCKIVLILYTYTKHNNWYSSALGSEQLNLRTDLLVYRFAGVPVYQGIGIPMNTYTGVPVRRCTGVPVYWYTIELVYQCISVPVYLFAVALVHR